MKRAIDNLHSCFPNIQFTSIIESAPCGAIFKGPFLNILAYFETNMVKEEIQGRFKSIEKVMGRQPSHKAEGIVIIDIDLIQWNNEVLKPDDFKRDYMNELIVQMQRIACK
jgi:2-amino-4-hydroxy-6-hydroxymethyldihydropteridine diphosphokinase